MPILNNVEVWYPKVDPARPNARFSKKNPTWEVQLRTYDKEVKKQWEALNLPVRPVVPDEGAPYFRVNLRKKSIREDLTPAAPVQVIDGNMQPVDPNTIGNGSMANVRIYQYEYDKNEGGKGTASILMGIQLLKHIMYAPKPREDDFESASTETVIPPGEEEAIANYQAEQAARAKAAEAAASAPQTAPGSQTQAPAPQTQAPAAPQTTAPAPQTAAPTPAPTAPSPAPTPAPTPAPAAYDPDDDIPF